MPPNILLIQCDDLGPDDLGLDGPYTPVLTKLAAQSFSALDFSVQPVSAPSRAVLLTGRHSLRTGVSHVHGGKDFLHLHETTLAERFRAGGYATGIWGKWHLGHTEGYFPWQRGFDDAYMADLYRHRDTKGQRNGAFAATEKWADAHIVDLALDFIRRHRKQNWFACIPSLTPHTPHDAPEKWVNFHRDRGCPPGLAVNRAMISALDEQIGRLLDGLETSGLAQNTLVVFLSDHGPAFAGRDLNENDRRIRNRSGRCGWKGDLYENGVQSPLLIRWPDQVAPRHCADPIQLLDLPPTLLEICGMPVDGMEGRSFSQTLLHGTPHETGDIFTYAHRGWLTSGPPYSLCGIPGEYNPGPPGPFTEQCLSLRRGRMKLIQNPDFDSREETVLYDLSQDPAEQTDLAQKRPECLQQMTEALRLHWESILREPHAFQSPVLHLRDGENRFPANLPCFVSGGTVNTVTGITGWDSPGATAAFRVHLSKPAALSITLLDADGHPAPGCWELQLDAEHTAARIEHGRECGFRLPAGERKLRLRAADVPAGTSIGALRFTAVPG